MRMRPGISLSDSCSFSTCLNCPARAAITSDRYTSGSPVPPRGGGRQERPGRPDQQPEIKPYERVITKDAKSDEGIFTVHTIKEKISTRSQRTS